jgi:hypothetical protein
VRAALTALLTVAVVFGGAYGLGVALAEDEVYVERVPDWEVVAVADDGRSFTIQYSAGNPACHSEVVGSRETPVRVLVTVLDRAHVEGTGSNDNCEDFAVNRRREIDLDEPLGSRWVVDATTGRRIGTFVCSPASSAPGCRAGAELGTAYPLRLDQQCGVVAAFFDGRWWQPERPRVHALNNDVGDPVYDGWIWEIDGDGIWHPIAAPGRTTRAAETVPGTMTLVSPHEARFRRPGYRAVRFVPRERIPPCQDGRPG